MSTTSDVRVLHTLGWKAATAARRLERARRTGRLLPDDEAESLEDVVDAFEGVCDWLAEQGVGRVKAVRQSLQTTALHKERHVAIRRAIHALDERGGLKELYAKLAEEYPGLMEGAGEAPDTRVVISLEEADAVARKLAAKSPGFVLGTAEEWAAAIERKAGKKCSKTKAKCLPFWTDEMERQERKRSGARSKKGSGARSPGRPGELSDTVVASQRDRSADDPCDQAVAKEEVDKLVAEEKVTEAERAVLQSSMGENERRAVLEKLHDGINTPAQVIGIAKEYPPARRRGAPVGA